jgi:PAS domain S-box-containing protein
MTDSRLRAEHEQLKALSERQAEELAGLKQQLDQETAERRRGERRIRDSEALYSSLIDSLPVHVIRKNLQGCFAFVSRSFCELIGIPEEEILGKTDFDLYPEDLARKYREDDQRVIETGELFETVEQNKTSGDIRFVEVMKAPVRDADGSTVGVQRSGSRSSSGMSPKPGRRNWSCATPRCDTAPSTTLPAMRSWS